MAKVRMATRTAPGSWSTTWTPEKVNEAEDKPAAFAAYCQQSMGVPWATHKDMAILRKRIKELFEYYPRADFFTLCRVAAWCKARRKRCSRVYQVVDKFRDAYEDGALPELNRDQTDDTIELAITTALEVEQRPEWRSKLIRATGPEARKAAYAEWQQSR